MLQIEQRESDDIDLFIADPQYLPYLNPFTQEYELVLRPTACESDGASAMKLSFAGVGEIDFICCADITSDPTSRREVGGRWIDLETPAEIIAKKVYYRGARMQPRDMFDLAAVAEYHGDDYVITALRECGIERCAKALTVVEAMKPEFAEKIISQLKYRTTHEHLISRAHPVVRKLLLSSLS